ncbi:MAG: sulfatase [Lentisphaeraceae bacterium]|nr:sulfatase [Lentisphaeraceae bacterium]
MKYLIVFALSCLCLFAEDKPNVLFIAIDDMRPELNCYGKSYIKSPHIDRLANKGLLFERAYCQEPICGPSRTSIMTGLRPEKNGVFHNNQYFRDSSPNVITLSQYFIQNGYNAAFTGKIYHRNSEADVENSWNFKTGSPKIKRAKLIGGYALEENHEIFKKNRADLLKQYGKIPGGLLHGPAFEKADVKDHDYSDGWTTLQAIETMKQMKKSGKPFFMAAGFKKPHLDFNAPKKYWDVYDEKDIQLAYQAKAPQGGATTGLHCSFELRTRHGIPKTGDIGPELSKTLLHAYYACASYVDAQVGKLLDSLDKEGLAENTIVVLWGDHGWHLGDMGVWGKATNYEIAARVPFMIYAPGMKSKGKKTKALVELMDIYPTLVDLAGLKMPEHLQGKSLVPLMNDSDLEWNEPVLTQYPNPALREWAALPLSPEMRQTFFGPLIEAKESEIKAQFGSKFNKELFENNLMGYSLRTDRYRFISWMDRTNKNADPIMVELYDYKESEFEKINIADKHPELVKALLKKTRDLLK